MKKIILSTIGIFFGIISIFLSGCNGGSAQVNITPTHLSQITKTPMTTFILISANTDTTITTGTAIASDLLQAPMTIDKTFDGKEIRVNLIKFTGIAPSTGSTVTINDIPATMNNDGTYYAYLDVNPGKNIIEIKTNSYGAKTSEQIAITFTPPVTIFLHYPWPPPSPAPDYTKVPLDMIGYVNNPAAKVEINGNKVAANSDGSFSSRIQLKQGNNSIKAVATLGNDSDTDGYILPVGENGGLSGPQPFLIHSPYSYAYILGGSTTGGSPPYSSTYQIGIGKTVQEDVQLLIKKTDYGDISPGSYFKPVVTRTSGVRTGDTLPVLPSLTVEFLPPAFRQYERIEYQTFMVIKAGPDLVPGNYYFTVDYDVVGGEGHFMDNIVIAVHK
jgi:hypothetical protein